MGSVVKIPDYGLSVYDDEKPRVKYLKFSDGTYTYKNGDDWATLTKHEVMVVDMETLAKGFQCWKVKKPVDEVWVTYSEVDASGGKKKFPKESDLEDHGPYEEHNGKKDGWSKPSMRVNLTHLQTGDLFLFTTGTIGGTRGLSDLGKAYMSNWRKTGKSQMPAVTCDMWMMPNKYRPKGAPAPKFEILGWHDSFDAAVTAAVQQATGNKAEAKAEAKPVEGELVV